MNRSALNRLRGQPGYALFYAGATVARVADEMFFVAVVLLVLDQTGSAALAGATVAAMTLPSFVSGPVLGAWLDLTGRRRALIVVDRVVMTGCVVGIVLVAGSGPDLLLPLLALVAGITFPLSFGGFQSLIPVLVPEELLPPANALEAASINGAVVAGPALAGGIAAAWGAPAAVLAEAALTVVALGLILVMPALDGQPARSDRSLGETVRAGLRHVVAVPILRGVTVTGTLGLLSLGLLTIAFPFFAVEELGADKSAAGYLWAAFAGGAALGALVGLMPLQRRFPPERIVVGAAAALGSLMLLWPLASSLPVALILIAVAGLADGPGLAATYSVRQGSTPRSLHGQVFTTAASLKVGAFAVGAAIAGPAVVGLGASGALLLAACGQFLAAAAGLTAMRLPAGRLAPAEAP